MSVIPFTTQLGPITESSQQGSQIPHTAVFVYNDNMTERQTFMMKECQDFLSPNIAIILIQAAELDTVKSVHSKLFVIASYKEETIRRIKSRFVEYKPMIYLPRAIIEARGHFNKPLPIRSLGISLTMHNCHVFLVKSCDLPSLRKKINEMSGEVVASFSDLKTNVVITDTAANKYCSKAHKRNIAVVTRQWVEDNYAIAREEDFDFFNREALSTVKDYTIKPFYGLHFKIMVSNQAPQIKKLLTDNQGQIIYGNENCLTHKVVSSNSTESFKTMNGSDSSDSGNDVKVVDVKFLDVCVEKGYYLSRRDYREHAVNTITKKERISPTRECVRGELEVDDALSVGKQKTLISSTNRFASSTNENRAMLPPPPQPLLQQQQQQPKKQQPNSMNDMIQKALFTFDTPQTQMASTQMRQLPDQELRIEQTFEPSQQLFWNDRVPKRG